MPHWLEVMLGALGGGGATGFFMHLLNRKWNKADQADSAEEAMSVREWDSRDASEGHLWKSVNQLQTQVEKLQEQRVGDWDRFNREKLQDKENYNHLFAQLAISDFHRETLGAENQRLKLEIIERDVQIRELRDLIRGLENRLSVAESLLNQHPPTSAG